MPSMQNEVNTSVSIIKAPLAHLTKPSEKISPNVS